MKKSILGQDIYLRNLPKMWRNMTKKTKSSDTTSTVVGPLFFCLSRGIQGAREERRGEGERGERRERRERTERRERAAEEDVCAGERMRGGVR